MTKEQRFNKVWSNTHTDYRGRLDGKKSILALDPKTGGTVLETAATISNEELESQYRLKVRK